MRWFILEDGILSYYKSYDEVSQGCKGSINVAVCEIVVSHNDHSRFDLIISGGEQV
jgi:pleckstrin family protein A (phosphoinositide binding specific) protein 8